jgi:thiamine-phosphate pyrophosphorylase
LASPGFSLYLVTDRGQTRGRDLAWVVEEALGAGLRAVQLREKDLCARDLFALAERLKALCERYGAELYVNDRIDVALAVDADGVQLAATSVPLEAARSLLGPRKRIGVSVHQLREAEEAAGRGADFVLFGPVYFTPSKASYGPPQGLARLREVAAAVPCPVYAIGGIKPENVAAVMESGVRGVALVSAILAAPDPRQATAEMLRRLEARGGRSVTRR